MINFNIILFFILVLIGCEAEKNSPTVDIYSTMFFPSLIKNNFEKTTITDLGWNEIAAESQ